VGAKGGWREDATHRLSLLGIEAADPMKLELPSHKPQDIVRTDLAAIMTSDAVLVYAGLASWGTAMELWMAKQVGVPVVAWTGPAMTTMDLSPWLIYVTDTFCLDLASAVATVENLLNAGNV
jgi:hypothetical protein